METLRTDTPATTATSVSTQPAALPRHKELAAYNSAFVELGLRFRWDEPMFDWLCGIECERARIARYIEEYHAHLLTAYDADFLAQAILERKNAYLEAMGMRAN